LTFPGIEVALNNQARTVPRSAARFVTIDYRLRIRQKDKQRPLKAAKVYYVNQINICKKAQNA
jgi:hypothetical protein